MTLAQTLTKTSPLHLELKTGSLSMRMSICLFCDHMYQTSASLDCSSYFYPHCTYITHTTAVYTMRTTYPPTYRAISPLSSSRSSLFRSFFSQQSHLIHPDLRVDLQSRCYGTGATQVGGFFQGATKRNGVLVQPMSQWDGVTEIPAAAEQVWCLFPNSRAPYLSFHHL